MADNYTLDGDNYTKEDVLEAAEAKGLTIEDYISQYYPDDLVDSSPKPLEFSFGDNRAFTREQVLFENVEKLEDGTTKTSINKSLALITLLPAVFIPRGLAGSVRINF